MTLHVASKQCAITASPGQTWCQDLETTIKREGQHDNGQTYCMLLGKRLVPNLTAALLPSPSPASVLVLRSLLLALFPFELAADVPFCRFAVALLAAAPFRFALFSPASVASSALSTSVASATGACLPFAAPLSPPL
jgi:hypothetical protein